MTNPTTKKIKQSKDNMRRCVITGNILPKEDLIRIVKQKDQSFLIDSDIQGKGAYISKTCTSHLLLKNKRLLHKAFKTKVDDKVFEYIVQLLDKNHS